MAHPTAPPSYDEIVAGSGRAEPQAESPAGNSSGEANACSATSGESVFGQNGADDVHQGAVVAAAPDASEQVRPRMRKLLLSHVLLCVMFELVVLLGIAHLRATPKRSFYTQALTGLAVSLVLVGFVVPIGVAALLWVAAPAAAPRGEKKYLLSWLVVLFALFAAPGTIYSCTFLPGCATVLSQTNRFTGALPSSPGGAFSSALMFDLTPGSFDAPYLPIPFAFRGRVSNSSFATPLVVAGSAPPYRVVAWSCGCAGSCADDFPTSFVTRGPGFDHQFITMIRSSSGKGDVAMCLDRIQGVLEEYPSLFADVSDAVLMRPTSFSALRVMLLRHVVASVVVTHGIYFAIMALLHVKYAGAFPGECWGYF